MFRLVSTRRRAAGLALALTALTAPLVLAQEEQEKSFELSAAVPADVFLCVSQRPNAERAFLESHWAEVQDAFDDSGVVDDLLGLIPTLLGEEEQKEVQRLVDHATTVVEAVDWGSLGATETVFAERMPADFDVRMGVMPEMVWLFRGAGEGVETNYAGLVAILDAFAEEVNGFAGEEVLHVTRSERQGAQVAALIPPEPIAGRYQLQVARRGDVIGIGTGVKILDQSLALLAGEGAGASMAKNPAYSAAVASLPRAEDLITYFSMPKLLTSVRGIVDQGLAMATAEGGEEAEQWKGLAQKVATMLFDIPSVVDNVTAVEFTEGTSTHTVTRAALAADAKQKPIWSVFGDRPAIEEFDRFLPVETVSFSVDSGIDPRALYAFVEGSVRSVGEPGEALLAQWTGFQEQMGIDVAKDVFGWMEGETVSASWGGGMQGSWILLTKVTDEELARENVNAGIESLSAMIEDFAEMAGNPMLNMVIPELTPLEDERLPGFQTVWMGGQPAMIWGVAEGHLVLGSGADAVSTSLATARGEHQSVRQNEALMKRLMLPEGKFRSISYTDRSNLGQEVAGALGGVSMMGMMLPAMIPDPKGQKLATKALTIVGKLAPVAAELDFFVGTASYTAFDGQGWVTHEVTHYKPYDM